MNNMTKYEKVLFDASLGISICLKWLDQYDSEVLYNKTKEDLLKNVDPNNFKEYIENLLDKVRVDEISPLTEKVIDKKAGSFKKYDFTTEEYLDFYALTQQEREKAIETFRKVLTNIMTPAKHIDSLLLYLFFNQLKSFHD